MRDSCKVVIKVSSLPRAAVGVKLGLVHTRSDTIWDAGCAILPPSARSTYGGGVWGGALLVCACGAEPAAELVTVPGNGASKPVRIESIPQPACRLLEIAAYAWGVAAEAGAAARDSGGGIVISFMAVWSSMNMSSSMRI